MPIKKEWIKERDTGIFHPIERDYNGTIKIVTDQNFVGIPKEKVVGEFWYNKSGAIEVKLAC